MEFLETEYNWKNGDESSWEFFVRLWIIISTILAVFILCFRLYFLPKFNEYQRNLPKSTKQVQQQKKVNVPKENTINNTATPNKPISYSNESSHSGYKIVQNEIRKQTRQDQKINKELVREQKKNLKQEQKLLKQEQKLKNKLEKQKIKEERKKLKQRKNNNKSYKNDVIDNSSVYEVEMKGELNESNW